MKSVPAVFLLATFMTGRKALALGKQRLGCLAVPGPPTLSPGDTGPAPTASDR